MQQWLRQYQALQQKQHLAEADLVSVTRTLRDLRYEPVPQGDDADKLRGRLWARLALIQHRLQLLKERLRHVEPGPAYVDILASQIDQVERTITSFKEQQQAEYAELLHEEDQLVEEIGDIGDKILDQDEEGQREYGTEAWGSLEKAKAPRRRSGPGGDRGLPPEVVEYDDFVEEHGETGSWDPEDHKEFLKLLKACQGDYGQTLVLGVDQLYGHSRVDILRHCRWHADLMDLQMKKRVAIIEWRSKREEEKARLKTMGLLLALGDHLMMKA